MALRLLGLVKRYRDRTVLDDVSLHVRAGDCYGLLGHNGAGKTTAMRIALGLVRPDAGRVLVEGFDSDEHPLEARARMGALVETTGFHGSLSGRENLRLLARLGGLGRREAAAEADRVLEVVGLLPAAGRSAGTYSQGMRQRLGLAQALLGRPRIVLLDEPTNGLDPEGIEEMRRLLLRLTRDEGTTVLLSSHQLHEVAEVCTRVGILREGRRVLEAATADLLSSHADRHVARTGDDPAASRALAAAGFSAAPRADGGLDVTLGRRPAGEAIRALVTAGVEVRAFAPHPVTLEEVYLRASREGPADAREPDAAPAPTPPRERRAPPRPALRVARYDLRRWSLRPAVALTLAAPAVAAVLAVGQRAGSVEADRARVAAGKLASAAQPTAFEAVAVALRVGLPCLAVVLCALAALSVAGEFAGGTLRNVLLRPVGRGRAVLGKALAVAAAGSAGAVVLVSASLLASGAWFDFGDLEELLITGDLFPLQPAEAVWPDLRAALWMPLPGLAAFAALGLLLGAACRSGASAVGGAVACCAALALAPALVPSAWLPSAWIPLLRDDSQVQRLLDVSRNVSNAAPASAGGSLAIPLAWASVSVAAACILVRRRPIP